jgi:hypothetical protein
MDPHADLVATKTYLDICNKNYFFYFFFRTALPGPPVTIQDENGSDKLKLGAG